MTKREINGEKWLRDRRAGNSWYILQPERGMESAAVAHLKARGINSFYPVKKVAYKREKEGKRVTVEVKRPEVTGYIAARMGANPDWWAILGGQGGEWGNRIFKGAINASDGFPAPLPKGEIQEFQSIAKRSTDIAKAMSEMEVVKVGHSVIVIDGVFAGKGGKVQQIAKGAAIIDGVDMGGVSAVWISLGLLRRV